MRMQGWMLDLRSYQLHGTVAKWWQNTEILTNFMSLCPTTFEVLSIQSGIWPCKLTKLPVPTILQLGYSHAFALELTLQLVCLTLNHLNLCGVPIVTISHSKCSMNSTTSSAMLRALSGQTGSLYSQDYRGSHEVLAAHTYIEVFAVMLHIINLITSRGLVGSASGQFLYLNCCMKAVFDWKPAPSFWDFAAQISGRNLLSCSSLAETAFQEQQVFGRKPLSGFGAVFGQKPLSWKRFSTENSCHKKV